MTETGNSTADGAKAIQQSGTATWTISTTQDAYTLRYNASGKVLDVNAGESPMEVFHHPYAYAAWHRIATRPAPPALVRT